MSGWSVQTKDRRGGGQATGRMFPVQAGQDQDKREREWRLGEG